MATIEQHFFDRLSGFAGLAALVSTRVYTGRAPQNATTPYVLIRVIWKDHQKSHSGVSGLVKGRMEIDCVDPELMDALAVGCQVHQALETWVNTSLSPAVKSCTSLPDPEPLYDEEIKVWQVIKEFNCWHTE